MMELERHAPVPEEVATIASRYRLTAYDAAYLWLAGASRHRSPPSTGNWRVPQAIISANSLLAELVH